MAKVGDTVRYLNATGGGVITRIDGKIAYVEEDGFETPVLLKEVVVVLPAGHQPEVKGANLMFDQGAYNAGKQQSEAVSAAKSPKAGGKAAPAPVQLAPAPETDYGDEITLSLAFEPSDLKKLSQSSFNAVLVNDSNYALTFIFAGKAYDSHEWSLIYKGEVEANELIDLASFDHTTLGSIESVCLQAVAFKKGKPFELRPTVNIARRLDLTKFHKLHCFRPGRYFDNPVLEYPLLSEGRPAGSASKQAELSVAEAEKAYAGSLEALKGMYAGKEERVSGGKGNTRKQNTADNPHKLLPLIRVDLHMDALTDTLAGMSNSDMLNMQLDTVRRTMQEHSRRIGQKIVFIHGKGEGVLRKAVMNLLRKEYPSAELQDASFREFGFGATLVTIHTPKAAVSDK